MVFWPKISICWFSPTLCNCYVTSWLWNINQKIISIISTHFAQQPGPTTICTACTMTPLDSLSSNQEPVFATSTDGANATAIKNWSSPRPPTAPTPPQSRTGIRYLHRRRQRHHSQKTVVVSSNDRVLVFYRGHRSMTRSLFIIGLHSRIFPLQTYLQFTLCNFNEIGCKWCNDNAWWESARITNERHVRGPLGLVEVGVY